ncbi:glycoside hydrolase family 43 protein [Lactococcus insecticola]|uniref:Glycoside hydrolase n=1 Tax=Pseudolactococcus insecticola TaxID=2709158 RepID=A0A6A0B920_9LACT|nr:glycoside hydrolase family 43 protein [Lactococcus insecticola]GFH40337.1 glycoside hydrolase [Lactococcus insecticola]
MKKRQKSAMFTITGLILVLGVVFGLVYVSGQLSNDSEQAQVRAYSSQLTAQDAKQTSSLSQPDHEVSYDFSTDNFADPSAIKVGNHYYAYATSTDGLNIPLATSDNGKKYRVKYDALPVLPSWAKKGIWAPHILSKNGKYFLYFSAKDKVTNKRSIGVATSQWPDGPFIPDDEKVAENDALGGLIDPATFSENGDTYLLYKNDGNAINLPSSIWIQKLTQNGMRTDGAAYKLLTNTQVPNPVASGVSHPMTIEAPFLTKTPDGRYLLLFSGNSYATTNYFTGYATSTSLLTGYVYQSALLTTAGLEGQIKGPGGAELVAGEKSQQQLVLHGWVGDPKDKATRKRKLYILPFSWTTTNQPQIP